MAAPPPLAPKPAAPAVQKKIEPVAPPKEVKVAPISPAEKPETPPRHPSKKDLVWSPPSSAVLPVSLIRHPR